MITKTVKRYWCEYCGKARLRANVMKKHESRCTLNPHRHCGMCALLDKKQAPLQPALLALPVPEDFWREDMYGIHGSDELSDAVNKVLPSIRRYFNDCPACIMAALRQKGIPVPLATDFMFTNECKAVWDEFNHWG